MGINDEIDSIALLQSDKMGANVLESKELTKRFGGVIAVDGVSLSVKRDEVKALIGPNGAGKTTLFNLLSGALEPTAGRIYLDEEEITDLPPERIARRGVARSFQITNLFEDLSVLDNVRVAVQAECAGGWNFFQHVDSKAEYRDRALEIIETVGLAEYRDKIAGTLSHGDKRALELGLVLALNPEVLLLDEPFAGMSRFEIEEMQELLEDISGSYTVLLVEHNIDVVMAVANNVAVLDGGELIADGTPKEVQQDERVQNAYLGGHR
jgi:branched-chain amino acid transport system ATP-binding protein